MTRPSRVSVTDHTLLGKRRGKSPHASTPYIGGISWREGCEIRAREPTRDPRRCQIPGWRQDLHPADKQSLCQIPPATPIEGGGGRRNKCQRPGWYSCIGTRRPTAKHTGPAGGDPRQPIIICKGNIIAKNAIFPGHPSQGTQAPSSFYN